jgi:hypothetical protein
LRKLLVIAAAVVFFVGGRPGALAQDTPPSAPAQETPANGINGKWHFVLSTPGGDRDVDADFTVDNDGNVTGKWGNADVAGSWKEGKLDLKFPFTSDEAGVTDAMKINGKLDEAAALAGDWAFSEYNGTFKATRPGATPAPAPAPADSTPSSSGSQPH